MADAGLTETERALVRARDWLGIVQHGVNFFALEKWARVLKVSNLSVYAGHARGKPGCVPCHAAGSGGLMTTPEAPAGTAKEALLLIPGLLCDATVWRHQLAELSAEYALKAADPLLGDSISAMAAKLLDQAPPRLSVAGHSMGARVALEMIRMAPRTHRSLGVARHRHASRAERVSPRDAKSWSSWRSAMACAPLRNNGCLPWCTRRISRRGSELRRALFAMVERMSPELHRDQIHALLTRPPAEVGSELNSMSYADRRGTVRRVEPARGAS